MNILKRVRFQNNFFKLVRFQKKFFTTCHILFWTFFSKKRDAEWKHAFKKSRFDWIYPVKLTIFASLCIFKKHDSDAEEIFENQIFKQNFYNESDFKTKILQHVRS